MGWGRFLLLGNLGQQLDLGEQQRSLERIRGSVEGQYHRDARQDQQLRMLWTENVELKLTVNRLASLLVQRGVITADDVRKIAGELEQAEGGRADPSG
jgi:hypothetical protein